MFVVEGATKVCYSRDFENNVGACSFLIRRFVNIKSPLFFLSFGRSMWFITDIEFE